MNIKELFTGRYGLTHDPGWNKYHQWPWDYFPIRLPACTVSLRQSDTGRRDVARVSWEIEKGVPVVSRFDDASGRILFEILPENPCEEEARSRGPHYLHSSRSFEADALAGLLGFSFEWVFEIPVKPPGVLQTFHPLGVVRVDAAELIGKDTTIKIDAGGWQKARSDADAPG